MGKSYDDIKNNTSFFSYKVIDDNSDSLVKVQVGRSLFSGRIILIHFKRIKQRAEHILKTPVNKAVITVPAYFNDAQRQQGDAGKLATMYCASSMNQQPQVWLMVWVWVNLKATR